jgi:adenine-specific DNA-methyltransferase
LNSRRVVGRLSEREKYIDETAITMNGEALNATTAKLSGAFYTPQSIAESLARWALQTGSERVLEPSVGKGALLKAAMIRASELAPPALRARPTACDIDRVALANLQTALGGSVDFQARDFLELDPASFPKFEVVLANPPFTRNHSIDPDRRKKLKRQFGIKGPAGIWVHFLAHSMDFLVQGGRIASVVPGSALFTQYGDAFLRRMCQSFLAVNVYQLAEKAVWTGGPEERGSIILAEGYGQGTSESYITGVWPPGSETPNYQYARKRGPYRDLIEASRPLGDLSTISIGAVTGCNAVFLLTEEERAALGLSLDNVRLTVSRARHVEGVSITQEDLVRLARAAQKIWLLTPRSIEDRGTPTRKRLAQITKHKRRSITWLNKRHPWWQVDVGPDCDAVFTYMNGRGPRLALTAENIICTNTLHRIIFNPATSEIDKMAAALTFISTFGQLAGEEIGRVYGGGVLKFELTEARSMPTLSRSDCGSGAVLYKSLHMVDAALRAGAFDEARDVADEALLPCILGPSWRSGIAELREAVRHRRDARHNGRALLRDR